MAVNTATTAAHRVQANSRQLPLTGVGGVGSGAERCEVADECSLTRAMSAKSHHHQRSVDRHQAVAASQRLVWRMRSSASSGKSSRGCPDTKGDPCWRMKTKFRRAVMERIP